MKRNNRLLSLLLSFILVISLGFNVNASTQEADQQVVGDMGIHFLDVGQGLSILIQSGGQNLVFDGGDRSNSSFVVSYLQNQNIETIDYLIASHYDEDHIAGLVGCLNAFEVDNIIGPDYEQDTKIYQSFLAGVDTQEMQIQHPAVGSEFEFGSGKFTILAPQSIGSNDNDNSVAIKLENGNNSFIFTGDAEANSESAMCNSGIDLSCDVLVPGHHGSVTATTWDLLEKTVPEYAVISCGTDNQYGHPHKDTMDKLESMGIQVYRTDKQGTITALSDGNNITWSQSPCNDYTAGDSEDAGTQPQVQPAEQIPQEVAEPEPISEPIGASVWISATGSKYHNKPDCGNMNPDNAFQMSQSEAESAGYEPCKKCF